MEAIQEHLMTCRACAEQFDMGDLDQVFYHEQPNHLPVSYDSLKWLAQDKTKNEKVTG